MREKEVTKPHAEGEELEEREGKYQNKRERSQSRMQRELEGGGGGGGGGEYRNKRGHKAACRENKSCESLVTSWRMYWECQPHPGDYFSFLLVVELKCVSCFYAVELVDRKFISLRKPTTAVWCYI